MNPLQRHPGHKDKAQHRAALLWEWYYENDGHITCAEVERLTGKRASNLYWTFQTHQVKAPPVWDTKAAIRQRHIKALWHKFDEIDREWLSVDEAAEALGKPQKDIYSLRRRYRDHIPEIRNMTTRRTNRTYEEKTEAQFPSFMGNITPRHHPAGLLVMAQWPGPGDNEITYLLR